MKRSLSSLGAAAMLLGATASMADSADLTADPGIRECSTGDRIQNLTVQCQGPIIQITVRTNPSTGFDWYFRNFDPNQLAPGEKQYRSTSKDPTISGAPSTGIYTARILQSGRTVFDFWYMRNWKGGEVAHGYRFTVIPDDSGSITGYHLKKLSHQDWKEEYRD